MYKINLKSASVAFLGSAILAFGLFNIHSMASITEGGVLGASLLIEHWTGISPALSSIVLNCIFYFMGIKTFGKKFIVYSLISALGFSFIYYLCELSGPVFPQIGNHPFIAAISGSIFVGVGAGLCVRVNAAPGGDDALALSLSHRFGLKIETVYLISDIIVLTLSVSYIPISEILYSFLTIFLSGRIIGIVQRF